MSRTLRVLGRAAGDVDSIFTWLMPRSTQGAISWYMALRRTMNLIAAAPENYGTAPESSQLGRELRQAFFKTRRGRLYRITFTVLPAEIVILRVRGPGQPPLRRRDLPQ